MVIPAKARRRRSRKCEEFYVFTLLRNRKWPKAAVNIRKFSRQPNTDKQEEPMNPKDEALAAIERARLEMEEALCQLEHVPMFDSGQIAYAAHAMQSYLGVIDGTTGLLAGKLRNLPDEEIERWLTGIRHATQLMSHTVCQLMNTASTAPSLKMSAVDFVTLAGRACAYYRRMAARKDISLTF